MSGKTRQYLAALGLGLSLASPSTAAADQGIDPAPPDPVAQAQPQSQPPPPKRPTVRIHITDEMNGDNGFGMANLLRAEYEDFGIGFKFVKSGRNHQATYGVRVPAGKPLNFDLDIDVLGRYRLDSMDERSNANEIIASFSPLKERRLNFIGRYIDDEGDGFSVAANGMLNPVDSENNIGGGIGFTDLGCDEGIGGYLWGKSEKLGGLMFGVGKYYNEKRFLIGMPNRGRFTWRCIGIDNDSGLEKVECILSSEGVNLNEIDFWSILHTNEFDHCTSLLGGGVFQYQMPPMSARGRGVTGGITYLNTPTGEDSLGVEVVNYFGNFFAGVGYSGLLDDYGKGKISIPLGWQFDGGDGLTRNFIRAEPFYKIKDADGGLRLVLEYRF
jgi:hypothetical protein